MTDQYARLIQQYAFPRYPGGVRPSFDGYGTVNMMQSVLAAFGAAHDTPLAEHDAFISALRGRTQVLFLILDGLGWHNIAQAIARRPAIAELLAPSWQRPLTTVFPSTTTAAMTTLMTGVPPARHGVLGYIMAFPEYGRVFNMISFRTPDVAHEELLAFGFNPSAHVTVPTTLRQLDAAGVHVGAYTYHTYADSGLSHLLYGSWKPYVYGSIGDLLGSALEVMRAPGSRFLNLYWSPLDSIAHVQGADSDAYAIELLAMLRALHDTVLPYRDEIALVITADHGHIDGDDNQALDMSRVPGIVDALRLPPAGEGRAQHLFLHPERIERVATELGITGQATVLQKDEVLESGVLGGTPCPTNAARLGDLLVLPHGSRRIMYDYQPRAHTAMRGRHGGFSPEEMVVPLLVF